MTATHLGEFCPCEDKYMHIPQSESGSVSCSVLSDSLPPHGLKPAKPLCPWNNLGEPSSIPGSGRSPGEGNGYTL